FSFGDTDLDGKLSRDVFRELVTNGARLKKSTKKAIPPEIQDGLFRRLDADHDGSLSFQEYRRLNELRAGAGFGRGPFAKKAARPFMKGLTAKKKAQAGDAALVKPKPASPPSAERPVTPEQAKYFETKIRPVLMTTCAKCHSKSAAKIKGGLLVDSRE